VRTIDERLRSVEEKKWVLTLGSTELVFVEQAHKIAGVVLFAKDFIGQAASNEPHAALAWAGVSVILPLLPNPTTQNKAAMSGLADIADLMLRYKVIEDTYRGSDTFLL
jgi:hypothetical protein